MLIAFPGVPIECQVFEIISRLRVLKFRHFVDRLGNESESLLSNIMRKRGRKMDEISRFAVRIVCYVSSRTRTLFSFIAVTQYDVRALRAHQGKEYRVIDGIINSAAMESRDVRSTDRYRLQVDKSLSWRRSVKY